MSKEHFPELHNYKLTKESNGDWTLDNITTDGRKQHYRDLVFHGGPGSTLEMRLFSLAALKKHFELAGFVDLLVHDSPDLEHGILWTKPWGITMSVKRPA